MISDLSFCMQVRQKTSHSFLFEDSYDSLCYKFYLQDIEEQNLKLKTERNEPPADDYTEDTKPLIETLYPINWPEKESTSISSTPILNIDHHNGTEETFEGSFDKKKETDKTHTEERDSDFGTNDSITFNSSHTETKSKTFKEEPIDKNLHL